MMVRPETMLWLTRPIDISEADEPDMVAASKATVTNKADKAKNNKADEAFAPEAIDATATDEANVADEAD